MKVGRAISFAAACLLASACYHQVVQTGKAPGPVVVSKDWTATWMWGLVPAQAIDVTQQCAKGIATVSTQLTVPNWLASAVTLGIYSPRSVTITCAVAASSVGSQEIQVARTATPAERVAAFEAAVELSERSKQAVTIRF